MNTSHSNEAGSSAEGLFFIGVACTAMWDEALDVGSLVSSFGLGPELVSWIGNEAVPVKGLPVNVGRCMNCTCGKAVSFLGGHLLIWLSSCIRLLDWQFSHDTWHAGESVPWVRRTLSSSCVILDTSTSNSPSDKPKLESPAMSKTWSSVSMASCSSTSASDGIFSAWVNGWTSEGAPTEAPST